jgi:hypothetical protein
LKKTKEKSETKTYGKKKTLKQFIVQKSHIIFLKETSVNKFCKNNKILKTKNLDENIESKTIAKDFGRKIMHKKL